MASDQAGRVGIGVVRGFIVGWIIATVPTVVEECVDGVGFDREGADDGYLKVLASAGAGCPLGAPWRPGRDRV